MQVDNQKVCWTPRLLVICTILMYWTSSKTLQDRFAKARDTLVGLHKSRKRPGESYQGFMARLLEQSAERLAGVCRALREAVRRVAGPTWQIEGWLLCGVDGTRSDCPMTAAKSLGPRTRWPRR